MIVATGGMAAVAAPVMGPVTVGDMRRLDSSRVTIVDNKTRTQLFPRLVSDSLE